MRNMFLNIYFLKTFRTMRHLNSVSTQLLVSCSGGRRPVDGLRQQHAHTIGLLVWDTLEDFYRHLNYMTETKTIIVNVDGTIRRTST
jgi:hypothetical protein